MNASYCDWQIPLWIISGLFEIKLSVSCVYKVYTQKLNKLQTDRQIDRQKIVHPSIHPGLLVCHPSICPPRSALWPPTLNLVGPATKHKLWGLVDGCTDSVSSSSRDPRRMELLSTVCIELHRLTSETSDILFVSLWSSVVSLLLCCRLRARASDADDTFICQCAGVIRLVFSCSKCCIDHLRGKWV